MRMATVIVTLGVTAAVAMAQPSSGPPAAKVVVDQARLELIEPRREVTGELRAIQRSDLASEQSGLVTEMLVEEGDTVAAGDVLIRLDDTLARLEAMRSASQRQAAQAIFTARQAQLERAKRDYKNIQSLGESASEKELLDAQSDVVVAEAQLAGGQADLLAAEAQESLDQERLAQMVVRAPFSGNVIAKRTEVGQWVGVGDEVVELVNTSRIDAWLDVPESLISRLEMTGIAAQVRLRATGEVFSAPVSSIVQQADPLARLFPVRVRLDNTQGRLKPGMSIVGLAPTGRRQEMLTIHKDALLRDDGGAFVYYDADGVAAAARVQVLFAVGDRLVIRATALDPDVSVVVEGNERLYPGQPLNIVESSSAQKLSRRGD
jgi:RND family efflux transporter MFP subunit